MIVPCPTTAFRLSGVVTVDASEDPEWLLPQVRGFYQGSVTHASRWDALSKALASRGDHASIVGFGLPGVIITGSGRDHRPTQPSTFISPANQREWTADVEQIARRSAVGLTLCACHTGAGTQGARLLRGLASLVGGRVSAPTGFVFASGFCRSLYLQEHAFWRHSDDLQGDGTPPRPYETNAGVADLPVRLRRHLSPLRLEDLDWFHVTVRSVELATTIGGVTAVNTWRDGDARLPLAYLGLHAPFVAEGTPLAVRTGTLTVTFAHGRGTIARRFAVLNDRLLRDVVVADTYYWANIDELLESLPLGRSAPLRQLAAV